ncbi:hypothetical protein EAG_15458 [Camponotus floridanus]|uniref:Uncharacterized protein n=1 Tax=Camponotus floridanus TaxID=104421 RepID=E2AT86_CAMFO|nr:hypothetical protein EAG_15458 [Camponotus floridanus]
MAEQIRSHEVVRDHLIGCGDGFTNSYLTRSHVPCLHEVGSHPVVLFPYVPAHDHEARDKSLTAPSVYNASMRSYLDCPAPTQSFLLSFTLDSTVARSAPLSFYSFLVSPRSCPVALAYKRTCVQREFHVCERHKVTTSFTSSSVPTRKEEVLTMPVGKMRDNSTARGLHRKAAKNEGFGRRQDKIILDSTPEGK